MLVEDPDGNTMRFASRIKRASIASNEVTPGVPTASPPDVQRAGPPHSHAASRSATLSAQPLFVEAKRGDSTMVLSSAPARNAAARMCWK